MIEITAMNYEYLWIRWFRIHPHLLSLKMWSKNSHPIYEVVIVSLMISFDHRVNRMLQISNPKLPKQTKVAQTPSSDVGIRVDLGL